MSFFFSFGSYYRVTSLIKPVLWISINTFSLTQNGLTCTVSQNEVNCPDSKVHGANMGSTWGLQDPGGLHVDPMNLAIWACIRAGHLKWILCSQMHYFLYISLIDFLNQVRPGSKKVDHNQYIAEPQSNKNCCQSIVKSFSPWIETRN